ncbi:MAG: peptide deformylase [Clostridia bacterium]|nr:peptide deformylase [Clostridia bacterium]
MATRNVVLKDDPILRKQSREVTKFDERLWTLLDDMAETMYADDGVGLAAVQVATLKRAVVIDIGDERGIRELINPKIVNEEGIQYEIEGCLSIPGEYYETIRPEKITVEYQDRYGEPHVEELEGFPAVCYCHEIDHTNGILFLDRLNPEPHDREELEERARARRSEKNGKG